VGLLLPILYWKSVCVSAFSSMASLQEHRSTFRIFQLTDFIIGMCYALSYAGFIYYADFWPIILTPHASYFFVLPGVIAALFIINSGSLAKVIQSIDEREPLLEQPSTGDVAAAEKHLSCSIVGNMVAAFLYFLYRIVGINDYISGEYKDYLIPAALILVAILLEKLGQALFIMKFRQVVRGLSSGDASTQNVPAAAAYPIAPVPAVAASPAQAVAYPVPTAPPQ
jgi:hypothetical protein